MITLIMACVNSSCCGLDKFIETDFESVLSCRANGIIPVTKFVSKSTGFVVFHAEVEGPIVNGYICIATRAEDDDGLPHTLEHMIFLGSEDYPYPGVLDLIANKCMASGTNAWTEVDNTCFTLSTAGSDGFCKLLPIYMDHVFYPLLTDAAFKTEVYHVNGSGTDAGVVYSEMLSLESTGYSKASDELFKTIFSPNSGYHWNTGGCLNNIRESCNNQKVKDFHRKFYHPRNACLIVCGKISQNHLLRSLYRPIKKFAFKEKEAHKNSRAESDTKLPKSITVEKPWVTEYEIMREPSTLIEKTIQFPSFEEDECYAIIGFLGPSNGASSEFEDARGMELILHYLSKDSSSPLQQDIVEKGLGLATSLSHTIAEYSRVLVYFELEGIDLRSSKKIVTQMKKSLEDELKFFDMSRMTDVIKNSILYETSAMEKIPHDHIAQVLINYFLYDSSKDDSSFLKRKLNKVAMFETLLTKPETYWVEMIKEKILGKNWVTVFAEPSQKLCSLLVAENEERIAERIATPGSLEKYARELDEAVLCNSKPAPSKILKKVRVPSMKSIEFHDLKRWCNPSLINQADFPANICLDEISTSFVHAYLIMDTSELDSTFRNYLPLFKDVLLNSPILSDSGKQLISFEEVVAERCKDLLACEMHIGLEMVDFVCDDGEASRFSCGSFSHLIALSMQIELNKVDKGLDWMRKTLWRTKWQLERIKVAINKLLGETHILKRSGCRMCQAILKYLIYGKESNVVSSNILTQTKFLQSLGADDDKKIKAFENEVRTALDSILSIITDANNVSLHIASDLNQVRRKADKLECGSFSSLLKAAFPFELCAVGSCHSKIERRIANDMDIKSMIPRSSLLERSSKNQIIYGIPSEESAYLVMVGPALTSYESSELPSLLTLLQYLNQTDGPIYQKVRGRGYGYSYHSALRINEGLLYFYLARCSDLVGAYESVLRVVGEHQSKTISMWSSDLLLAAKSSCIFDCLHTEKTPLSLASNSCLAYYRNVSEDFIHNLVTKIAKVSVKDLKTMMEKYFAPMFQPTGSYATVIACPSDQVQNIKEGFQRLGKKMRAFYSFDDFTYDLCDSE